MKFSITGKIVLFFLSSFLGFTCITTQAQHPSNDKVVKFDDTRKHKWCYKVSKVSIRSSVDNNIQSAYFYKSKSKSKTPLIVSLHTWSGNYAQKDSIADLCIRNDINYIHPDFRGPNNSIQACCSDLVISDINDAIDYAIRHANVDTTNISIIGVSGGGYAALCCYLKLERKIKKFSAWVPITDLVAWYNESTIRKNKYANDIMSCTGSLGELDEQEAKKRSPLYTETPLNLVNDRELFIYAGVYDGILGSVPITHSINFYNKLLRDLSVKDSSKYVSDFEKLNLLEFRKPLGNYGDIGNRKVCLAKGHGKINLKIFEGGHEMLFDYAFNEINKN